MGNVGYAGRYVVHVAVHLKFGPPVAEQYACYTDYPGQETCRRQFSVSCASVTVGLRY